MNSTTSISCEYYLENEPQAECEQHTSGIFVLVLEGLYARGEVRAINDALKTQYNTLIKCQSCKAILKFIIPI